jgi:hypothetical protein
LFNSRTCEVVVVDVCVGNASVSTAVDVEPLLPLGAVVAVSLTATLTCAFVVAVGCGHGALCTYVSCRLPE